MFKKIRNKVNTAISTVRATVACKKAEGYVDSGVKILIAVVIGALLLAGLYVLFNTTIMLVSGFFCLYYSLLIINF